MLQFSNRVLPAAAGAASFTRLMQKKSVARLCSAIAPIKEHKTPMPARSSTSHTRARPAGSSPTAPPAPHLAYSNVFLHARAPDTTPVRHQRERERTLLADAALLSREQVHKHTTILTHTYHNNFFTIFFKRFLSPMRNHKFFHVEPGVSEGLVGAPIAMTHRRGMRRKPGGNRKGKEKKAKERGGELERDREANLHHVKQDGKVGDATAIKGRQRTVGKMRRCVAWRRCLSPPGPGEKERDGITLVQPDMTSSGRGVSRRQSQ